MCQHFLETVANQGKLISMITTTNVIHLSSMVSPGARCEVEFGSLLTAGEDMMIQCYSMSLVSFLF